MAETMHPNLQRAAELDDVHDPEGAWAGLDQRHPPPGGELEPVVLEAEGARVPAPAADALRWLMAYGRALSLLRMADPAHDHGLPILGWLAAMNLVDMEREARMRWLDEVASAETAAATCRASEAYMAQYTLDGSVTAARAAGEAAACREPSIVGRAAADGAVRPPPLEVFFTEADGVLVQVKTATRTYLLEPPRGGEVHRRRARAVAHLGRAAAELGGCLRMSRRDPVMMASCARYIRTAAREAMQSEPPPPQEEGPRVCL